MGHFSPPGSGSAIFMRIHADPDPKPCPRVRVTKSRRRAGGGGGGLGSPLVGFSPNTELVFWLFLRSYLTSGPFSCWYFLLLKQRFFRYYSSRQVMAILCCVSQKAASASQLLIINMRTFWNCCLGRFREDGSMNTGSVHWPVCACQCDGLTEYSTQYSRWTRENAWVY